MIRLFNIKIIILISICALIASCTKSSDMPSSESIGKGGSTARFTIMGNHLYIVDETSLIVYNITNPQEMIEEGKVELGFGIETIFPYQDKLFIGSVQAMYIYSVEDPSNPTFVGAASHLRSCDPVVANDTMAYVTLRNNSGCGGTINVLNIYNIQNPKFPKLISTIDLKQPFGLGLNGDILYVCDDELGLISINVKNPNNPKIVNKIQGYKFRDLIPMGDKLFVTAIEGLIVYDATNPIEPIEIQVLN